MATPILNITELADGQQDQFITANEAFRALEAAANDVVTVDLSSGNSTISNAAFRGGVVFRATGNTVSRSITVPAIKRLFVVHNSGSQPVSVIRGSATRSVPAGEARLLYTDGTTNGLLSVAGGGGGALAVVADSTTSRTLSITDAGKYVRFTGTFAIAATVPTNASVPFAVGDQVHIRQAGDGAVTIAGDTGVTVNAPAGGSLVLAGKGATATLVKVGTDEWDLMGQVEEA